ncbi:hypothetical protein TNCV_1014241 [Trichonephila clavipes]|uniref:Uncharacterized protein n=1 Tax=Trichonephila clavipes TaxID=2585209 RepID=A0A8X7B9N3_TRICX|nr:hypothetical protein TNCV_1014241 [Trichonephila clavipes]
MYRGCGNPVVKVLDHGRPVMSSNLVPLKTRRVGEPMHVKSVESSNVLRWCGAVVWRSGASSGVLLVT